MHRMRIFQYYLPVFFWCWGRVKEQKASGNTAPLVIGIQAVQGCGKTTLVDELRSLFAHVGLKAASVSIDDFYLPFQKQQELIKVSAAPRSLVILHCQHSNSASCEWRLVKPNEIFHLNIDPFSSPVQKTKWNASVASR